MPSHHVDFCLQGTGRLDRLEDADHVARTDAEGVEAVDELLQADAFRQYGEAAVNWAHAFTLKDGKVARFREYSETDAVRRAYEP